LNTAQISYNSAYPTVGYATTLGALGGTSCSAPSSAAACLIDSVLAGGTKSGYSFNLPAGSVSGTPNSTYQFVASPTQLGMTGTRYFCTFADAVVRFSTTAITTCDGTIAAQQ
jgi:hypothetical protein